MILRELELKEERVMNNIFDGKVSFAIGTGRCGTKFLSRVLSTEPGVSAVHERNRLNEAFHRYCKWYKLPVDNEGFLHTKELEIQKDLKNHRFSFESSAILSLSVQELYSRFNSRFILLIRSPERVVNSYLGKGLYAKPILYSNSGLALGYQESTNFHHFLGRIVPVGDRFLQWNKMSRVGKLAWYWNSINAFTLEEFKNIPKSHWRIEKLEELSYDRYLEITKFLGFRAKVKRQIYDEFRLSRPNALTEVITIASWNASEIAEFETEVAPMAKKFGYEYRVDRLPIPKPISSLPKEPKTKKTSLKFRIAKIFFKLEQRIGLR